MFPCPVARHHVAVLLLYTVEFLIWHVVNVSLKVWTSEDVLDDFVRVPVPDIVLRRLPLSGASRFREGLLVPQGGIFPPDAAEFDCIDLLVKVFVVGDGWRVTVRNERCSPEFEELVNLLLREFGISKHELREFETGSGCERRPIVVCLNCRGFW